MERRGHVVVKEGSERWLRLGPTTAALSLLNALTFIALTVDADLVDVLGLPAGWGDLAQQPWRAFTVMFTSGHIAHLLVAVAVIVVAGGALERRVGSLDVLATYLLSGLAASVAVVATASAGAGSSETSLGASGAFLGLLAALAVMPAGTATVARLNLSRVVVVIVMVNLLQPVLGVGGWSSAAAHVTGLMVGTVYGLRMRARPDAGERGEAHLQQRAS
jgi:membrane associated rhomboid family serine protease